MVEFVETAVLRLRDQSSRPAAQINRTLTQLIATARKLNGIQANIKVGVTGDAAVRNTLNNLAKDRTAKVKAATSGVPAARKRLDTLARTRTSKVNAAIGDTRTVESKLNNLARTRNARINPQIGVPAGGPPGTAPFAPTARDPNTQGRGIAGGFLSALRASNAGRTIARGFLASIGGSLFEVSRRVARTTGSAPLNEEDAIARQRVSGRSEDEIRFIKERAEILTSEFQTVTTAQIIDASTESLGRFTDLEDPLQRQSAIQALERIARNTQIAGQVLPNGGIGGAQNQARLIETAIQQLGAAQDPARASEISRSILQALVAAGGDLQGGDVKRTLQQLPTGRSALGADTLQQILLLRDEGGRRSTGNFDQLLSDLIRGNLNEDDLARQRASGVRNADGTSDLFDGLATDMLGTVRNEILPRLAEAGIEVSRENLGAVRAFLDNELGLSKQGGIAFLTDTLVNLNELEAENARARRVQPEIAAQNPTTRQEARAVSAQFQNVAADALGGLLPTISSGLDTISDTLNRISDPNASSAEQAAGIAAAGTAAIPVAIGAALEGFADPATRPLAAAGLALTGSAVGLQTAAAALTLAAGAGAIGAGIDAGERRGRRGFFGRARDGLGALLGLVARSAPVAAVGAVAFAPTSAGEGSTVTSNPVAATVVNDDKVTEALTRLSDAVADARVAGRDQLEADLDGVFASTMQRIGERVQAGETLDSQAIADQISAAIARATNTDRRAQNAEAEDRVFSEPVRATDSFQRTQNQAFIESLPSLTNFITVSAEQQARIAALLERNDRIRDERRDAIPTPPLEPVAPPPAPAPDPVANLPVLDVSPVVGQVLAAGEVAAILPDNLEPVLTEGAAAMGRSSEEIVAAADKFGPAVAAALEAAAPGIGSIMGSAVRAAIGTLEVAVRQTNSGTRPTPALNTGGTTLE